MKAKWLLGTLFLILTAVGISWQPAVMPNQEIVIEFHDHQASPSSLETLEAVTAQLQNLGAQQISITEKADGAVSITYFSGKDIQSVQQSLFQKYGWALDVNSSGQSNPFQSNDSDTDNGFQLRVAKIQQQDLPTGMNGLAIEEIIAKDRYVIPKFYPSQGIKTTQQEPVFQSITTTTESPQVLATHVSYYVIPEVRAGPSVLYS